MKFLLFFLGITFYFLFYLFSHKKEIQGAFFPSLFIEAHIYIGLVILCIIRLTIQSNKAFSHQEQKSTQRIHLPQTYEIRTTLKLFFWKYVYFLALLLFYLSTFLIIQVLLWEVDIPKIFLLFNILVLLLLYIENKFSVFQDILRVNTALVSLYYLLFHIFYLLWYTTEFQKEDIANTIILGVLFYIFFRSHKRTHYKELFQSYALSFLFLELCVFAKYVFWDISTIFWGASFLFAAIFLTLTHRVKKIFHISRSLVRTWGLLFSYIFLAFFTWKLTTQTYPLILFLWSIPSIFITTLLFLFHKSFWSYLSLAWSILGVGNLGFLLFRSLFSEQEYIFFLLFSFSLLLFDRIQTKKYPYDTYLFHIISLIVNLFWVLLFFFFIDFSILSLAILLSIESLYFFASYYSLQKNSRLWYTIDSK